MNTPAPHLSAGQPVHMTSRRAVFVVSPWLSGRAEVVSAVGAEQSGTRTAVIGLVPPLLTCRPRSALWSHRSAGTMRCVVMGEMRYR